MLETYISKYEKKKSEDEKYLNYFMSFDKNYGFDREALPAIVFRTQ